MTLKTYQARSIAEALAAVKRDLGKDAVILHTRTFKRGGFFGYGGKQIVEITAGSGVALGRKRRPPQDSLDLRAQAQRQLLDRAYKTSENRGSLGASEPTMASPTQEAPESRWAAPAEAMPAAAAVPTARMCASPSSEAAAGSAEVPAAVELAAETIAVASEPPYRAARRVISPTTAGSAASVAELPAQLTSQISDLRAMVSKVLQQTHRPTQRADMPQELFDRYLSLLEAEVSSDIANSVVEKVKRELTMEELEDAAVVRASILREVAAYIPVADISLDRERPRDGRPLTIALVGPTGVGKTTTTAKLAAAYKLRHGKRVGLVTADTYRIAAVDQLRTYANIIGLPLRVALSPNEMSSAVQSLCDCDVVLIDTAGRSQHDSEKIDDLGRFIRAADPHEVHLVLSSTSSEKLMLRAVERFAPVEPSNVIFTKLDEAVSFGVLVNVIQTVKKRVSFITTGQEVPDHIEIGRADRLARIVVSGDVS